VDCEAVAVVPENAGIELITPTAGRTVELERFFSSVAAQTWPGPTRVILIDQNPDDRLVPLVEAWADRLQVAHLRSAPGVSRACNVGLRHATAAVIGRADDDCWYPPDTLERVFEAFELHPEWDALSGMSCDEEGRPTQLRWDRTAGVVTRESIFRRTIGFTLFMRRSLISALGEWDESYGPRPSGDGTIRGGSEDGEYALRILSAGSTIGFEPSIRIFHADFTPSVRDREAMRKAYFYGVDHSRLLKRYGYPAWYPGWRSVQLIAAAGLFLGRGEAGRARFYAAMARGRVRGMFVRDGSQEGLPAPPP
jgi:glycosyltransferase involved in cell wall biosynthesis